MFKPTFIKPNIEIYRVFSSQHGGNQTPLGVNATLLVSPKWGDLGHGALGRDFLP